MPSAKDHTLVAIYDGHGGCGAASFASSNLVEILENTKDWKSYLDDGKKNIHLLGDSLTQAFIDLDTELRIRFRGTVYDDASGCTAVCAIITPTYIICANIGDSRCILGCQNSAIVQMSEDHKPENLIEKNRIMNAGGSVHANRVDGILGVSRSFGDFDYKTGIQCHPKDQKVQYV